MKLCQHCIKLGRYSKTNLKIDLQEIMEIMEKRKTIMASDYIDLCTAKKEIIKRLIDKSLLCDCNK